jgi:hypothetical protein
MKKIADLERLLKACKDMGVAELSNGDFSVKFVTGDAARVSLQTGDAAPAPDQTELRQSVEQAEADQVEADAQEELALMQIEDPEQFEELLIQRELEQSEQTDSDDDTFI